MVQSLRHSSKFSLQRIQHHRADFLEPLQSRQCILVTGPMLVSPLSGVSRPRASYMTTLLKDIVEWCASKEIIMTTGSLFIGPPCFLLELCRTQTAFWAALSATSVPTDLPPRKFPVRWNY